MNLEELFCSIDDFCQSFEEDWKRNLLESAVRKRERELRLCLSEIMTIIVVFHQSHYRTFKHYYLNLLTNYRDYFPELVSYNRFVELLPSTLIPLTAYLSSRRGKVTGISYIDST